MTINVAPLPENGVAPAPATRATLPAVSSAGVSDAAAIARQQLPSAVPAPAQVAAYAPYMPPSYKPLMRTPSSALAAQMLAQGGEVSAEDLALFAPSKPAPMLATSPLGDAYLADLRMARGEVESPQKTMQTKAEQVARGISTPQAPESTAAAPRPPIARESAPPAGSASVAASLPSLFAPLLRKPSFALARGVVAYQVASARNGSLRAAAPEAS